LSDHAIDEEGIKNALRDIAPLPKPRQFRVGKVD
jgi:hypothetical protein